MKTFIKYKKTSTDKNLNLLEAQNVLLDTLYLFDTFCKENNIHYSLAYGSLLGAIRNCNIIEWDDDIDLMMSFQDFKQLKTKLNSLSSYGLNYYHYSNAKGVATNEVRIFISGYYRFIQNGKTKYITPLCIDVFPMVEIPVSERNELNKLDRKKLKRIEKAKRFLNFKENRYESKNAFIGFAKKIIQFFMLVIPSNYYHKKIDSILESFKPNSKNVLFSPYAGFHFLYFYDNDILNSFCLQNFGSQKVSCIKKSDHYLSTTYGNWKVPKDRSGGTIFGEVFLKR